MHGLNDLNKSLLAVDSHAVVQHNMLEENYSKENF